jgi:hypothetical protein
VAAKAAFARVTLASSAALIAAWAGAPMTKAVIQMDAAGRLTLAVDVAGQDEKSPTIASRKRR